MGAAPVMVAALCGMVHRTVEGSVSEIEMLRAEIADLKQTVIAFAGPWAVQYADQQGLPRDHLHAYHYDLLERCGARMANFTRADAMLAARAKP